MWFRIAMGIVFGLYHGVAAGSDYKEYVAVVGSELSVPCNATPALGDDQVTLVLWYRGDSGNPVYSVDTRPGMIREAAHFPSKQLSSRAYFNMSNNVATLTIRPVKEIDGGEYRCRVDFRRSRTMNTAMKIIVIVPPKSLSIRDSKNVTLSGVIGPFEEGSKVVLICEALGGRPAPMLSWWRGSTLLDDSYTTVDRGVVRNELVLLDLQREDMLTVLTCQASNTNLTVPVSSSVTIDLSLTPKDVKIITSPRSLPEGKPIEVTCQAYGSRPPARISWWVGQENLDHLAKESISPDGNVTVSVLQFRPTSEEHGKKLICRAQNPDLANSAFDNEWVLDVLFAPQLSLALGASQKYEHIREGTDVYFDCNIQANPPVTEVKWRFQSSPLEHRPSFGVIVRNHSLLLTNVGRRHRGSYQCLAVNSQGEGRSEEALLRVQFSPACTAGQKTAYGVAKHEEVNISCEVDADPSEVVFKWIFNNSAETLDVVTFVSLETRSIATYVPRTRMDYGTLSCWARNSIGVQREPCIFSIMPTEEEQPIAISAVLAVLMGLVGALVLLAIIIIFIMKSRSSRSDRDNQEDQGQNEKIPTPKLKHFEDDSPDVIPSKPFCTDYRSITANQASEKLYENVGEKDHTYENLINRVHYIPTEPYDDITYAELALPDTCQQPFVRHRLDPPTEYADIDFRGGRGSIPPTNEEIATEDCSSSPLVRPVMGVRVLPEECPKLNPV